MKNFNRPGACAWVVGLAGAMVCCATHAQDPDGAQAQADAQQAAAAESPVESAAPPKRRARARGRQEIELQTTSVSGNRELPRVMVVVPWKSAAPAELGGRPIVSLVEEALAPVDREVFQRELEYYGLLHGGPKNDAAQLAKTASNLTEE